MISASLVLLALVSSVLGQQVGTSTAENHPALSWQECTASGCTTKTTSVTLDSNWRWVHKTGGYTNCYTGQTWDTSICPDNVTCAASCALEGANYSGTYGITTSGSSLTLKFVTGSNIGSRVYLMENDSKYQMFNPLGKEFSFDVDVSKLPCGLNGALYFVQMDSDGGMAKYSGNKAGAKYGTGYCDAQCPRDIKFIAGEANAEGWVGSSADANAGTGKYGTCCAEMDIWEANSMGSAYTPHPCKTANDGGLQRCTGSDCGVGDRYASLCDADGCDHNPYRLGHRGFYGPGKIIDTTKPFKVVTQFITDNGSSTGNLKEIRRLWVQDGKVYPNSKANFPGLLEGYDSITDEFCNAQKCAFGDRTGFQDKGGLVAMGKSLAKGHVLVLSIWDDHSVNMLWLDSTFPTDADPNQPGIARGACATTSGVPSDVEANAPNSQVVFSNIRFGTIGSTYSGTLQTLADVDPPSGYVRPTPSKTCQTGLPTSSTRSSSSTSSSTSSSSSSRSTSTSTSTSTSRSSSTSTSSSRSSSSSSSTRTTTSTAPIATQTKWGQCGGEYYFGPTQCAAGTTCVYSNPWYSQCL